MGVIGRTAFGVSYSFALEGFEPVKVSISRFGENVKDWRPFWLDHFAPYYYGLIERNFETEGKYAGGWPALSEPYASWKAKHYPGKTILRRTDRLFTSLSWSGSAPGPDGIFRAGRQSLELGTSVPYAAAHQRGATRQRFISAARLPARPFLYLAQGMRSSIGRLMHKFVTEEARASGLGGADRVLAVSRFL